MIKFRNRVKELRMVRAGDLIPDENNWRRHGEKQQRMLERELERVGFAGAVLVRETPQGLKLIDGHLRAGVSVDAIIPALVTDVDEREAAELLMTFDAIGGMAEADFEKLREQLALFGDEELSVGVAAATRMPLPPEAFPAHDEKIDTEHQCPKCGYRWSGGKAAADEPEA